MKVNNVTVKTENLQEFNFDFAENYHFGSDGGVKGTFVGKSKLYLSCIYDKVLSTEEINQIKAYCIKKGYISEDAFE